jgi:hypothetical protein
MFGPSRRELHRMLERERLRNQQREAELLDRLMHMAEKPWTVAPADMDKPVTEPVDETWSAFEITPDEVEGYVSG